MYVRVVRVGLRLGALRISSVTALPRALNLTALPGTLWLAAVFRRTGQEDSARDRGDCGRQIEEGRGTSLLAARWAASRHVRVAFRAPVLHTHPSKRSAQLRTNSTPDGTL